MTVDSAWLGNRFREVFGRPPQLISHAPGRVNLIGEHTDYNEGFVLPAAIDRTVAAAAAARDDGLLRIRSLDYDQSDEFRAASVRRWAGSRGWRDYVRGVAWALMDCQVDLRGADVAISGDVPRAAGLSSSAAIEVAVAGALVAITGARLAPERLASITQKAENVFVGVNCGIMDQLASVLGKDDCCLFIDCRSLDWKPVPLPPGIVIMIIDSRVERKLADTDYNVRRQECARAAAALGVTSLRDAGMVQLEGAQASMDGVLYRRARHVITENERVTATAEAFRARNFDDVGRLMGESHASLRDDFEVSTPELDLLVGLAGQCEGVIGARLTGAGFGGCTVNLVAEPAVPALQRRVTEGYRSRTHLDPGFYSCRAGRGLWIDHV